jgi:hypothetical protein
MEIIGIYLQWQGEHQRLTSKMFLNNGVMYKIFQVLVIITIIFIIIFAPTLTKYMWFQFLKFPFTLSFTELKWAYLSFFGGVGHSKLKEPKK